MLVIPDELKPVFDRYRGTGKFTVGAVSEFVRHWNTIMTACRMDLQEWIDNAVRQSERNNLIGDDRRDYIDANIDFWVDSWRYANDGMVHFSRKNGEMFISEGMIELVGRGLYDYSSDVEDSRKSEFIFDLVKYNIKKENKE